MDLITRANWEQMEEKQQFSERGNAYWKKHM